MSFVIAHTSEYISEVNFSVKGYVRGKPWDAYSRAWESQNLNICRVDGQLSFRIQLINVVSILTAVAKRSRLDTRRLFKHFLPKGGYFKHV